MFNRIHFQWLQALAVLGLFIGALAPAAAMNAGERDAIIEKRNFAQTQPTPIDPGEWDQEWVSAAVGPGGGIHAVWSDNRDGSYRLRYSFKPAGGTWQGSAPLDPGGTGLQWGVEIAADGRGNLYAIWLDGRGEKFQIYFATRPAGGDWSAGAPISPTAQEQGAHSLAVNRRGQVIASWTVREAGGWNVFAALRSPDGTWGAVEQVTPAADNIYQLSTAIDDWGRASVSWRRRDWGEELTYKVFFATRPADGPWGEPELVCASADSCWSPSIAVDHDGNVHAIWRGRNGVYTAYRPVRGPWSTPVQVVQEEDVDIAALGVDSAGNAIAMWFTLIKGEVFRSIRYVGRDWSEKELLYIVSVEPAQTSGRRSPDSIHAPQSVSLSPSFVNTPGGFMFFPPVLTEGGKINLGSFETPPVGASGGCGGKVTAQSLGQNGDRRACPNGPQPPAGNVDDGGIGPAGPGEGAQVGGWPIEIKEIEPGRFVYIVDTPGVDGIYTNPEDAKRFAGTYVYTPPPQPGQPAPNPTAVAPVEEPPKKPAAVQVPLPPEPKPPDPETPEREPGNGPPPVTPQDFVKWRAWNVLIDFQEGKPLDERDWERLRAGEQYFVAPASQIIDLWRRAQRLPERHRPVSLVDMTRMSHEGFREYQEQVKKLEVELGLAPAPPPRPTRPPAQQRPRPSQPTRPPAARPPRRPSPRPGALIGTNPYRTPENQALLEYLLGSRRRRHVSRATDPVLPASGAFLHMETPLRVRGRGVDYEFRLLYYSQLVYDGPVGWGWMHNYDRRFIAAGGGSLGRVEGDGSLELFSFDGANYTPMSGRFVGLTTDAGGITLTDRNGAVETYFPLNHPTSPGALKSIADRNGNTMTFAYDVQGRLKTVTDTLGRDITYTYDANGRIISVTDFSGRTVSLAYDANGDLVSITSPAVTGTPNGNDFPQGKTTRFTYSSGFDDQRLNHNLIAIISPNEVADGSLTPRVINAYGDEGLTFDRVVSQSWGGGRSNASGVPAGGVVTLAYTTTIEADAPPAAAGKTTITDREGNVYELWHDGSGRRLRSRLVVGGKALVIDYEYNADGLITGVTYPLGNRLEYAYDEGATDPRARGNLISVRQVADPGRGCDGLGAAPCPDLVTTFTYEPNFQLLQSVTTAGGATTTYSYDAQGNLIRLDFPDVTVGPAAPQSAHLTWTYNQWGQPLTYTDAEGNVTTYAYYETGPAVGYQKSVTRDAGGLNQTTTYEYDAVGNVTAIIDPRGVRTEYVVNALDQVVQTTRSVQGDTQYATRYWYDANDNLVRRDVENRAPDLDANFHPTGAYSRDPANPWFSTTYAYDLLDNIITRTVEISATAQAVTSYRYDAMENPVSITLPRGNRVEYAYDERGLLTQMTLAAGAPQASVITYAYDGNGNPTRITDGEGNPTDIFYDGFDRMAGYVDAAGNITRRTYDADGNLTETRALDGQDGRNPGRSFDAANAVLLSRTQFRYDERGRNYLERREFFSADVGSGVITPITGDGDGDGWVETSRTFDRNDNLTMLTDDRGHATTYVYDSLNRLIRRTDALGDITAYSYDDAGNVVQTVVTDHQPDGLAPDQVFTTTFTYDALNRLTAARDNLGQTERFAYDSRGNRVFRSDANGPLQDGGNDHGNTTLYAYDGLGRLTRVTRHLREGGQGGGAVIGQAVTRYAHDGNGNLTRFTDANGHATAYEYDALDRLTRVTYADGTRADYAYDRAGNRVQETDPNGSAFTHTYDALNRLVKTEIAPGQGVVGTTMQTFGYDGLSRPIQATDNNDPADASDDSTVALAYDSLGNVLGETQNGKTVTATYDGLGNPLTLAHPDGLTLTYTYDALNRVKTVADADGPIATYDYIGPWRVWRRGNGNGTYVTYGYDDARRLTEIAHRLSSDDSLLTGFTITYDRAGNILSETAQPGDVQTTYAYDSLYRLTAARRPGLDQGFAYDLAGNRTQETRNGQTIAYATDEMNRYTAIGGVAQHYDANGNLVWDGLRGYRYDAFGRLAEGSGVWTVALPLVQNRATSSALASSASNIHASALSPFSTPAGRHAYDAFDRRILRRAGNELVHYFYADDQVVQERDGHDNVAATYAEKLFMERGGARSFYQRDAQGSVRGLTDATGSVAERVDYEAFGRPIFGGGGSSSALGNPYLWRGLRYDAADGLYALGGLRYAPARGRNLQP